MKELLQLLTRLCSKMTQAKVLGVYLTARMIISYSQGSDYERTIRYSSQLSRALYSYKSVVSDVASDQIDTWVTLCEALVQTGLDKDHLAFMSLMMPNVVKDWMPVYRVFKVNDVGRILVALCLVLRVMPPDNLIITKDWKNQRYLEIEKDCKRIGLDFESYDACWRAVHLSDLADSDHTPSGKVIAAKKLYHSMQLPMTDLLNDYARIYLEENDVDQKVATRGGRTTSQIKPLPESGKTEKDQELQEVLQALSGANPIDVVRGLFYSSQRNDAGFECTVLMKRFRAMVSPDDNVAVVNPSPDMILQLMQNKIMCRDLCFIVTDETVAKLYMKQFQCDIFRPMHCLSETELCFDKILITVRDSAAAPIFVGLQHASVKAQAIILAPETSLRQLYMQLKKTRMSISMVISVPNGVTQSSPRKKVLVEASTWWSIPDSFVLQRGFCDESKTLFSVEKISRWVPCLWIETNMSISDMRKTIDQKPVIRKISDPLTVRYSPEITIQLTIQKDRGGKCAGRACYRRILRPEDKHRKRGDRLTPVVEKGLRWDTVEEVIAAVETVVLDERIAPEIVDDISDAYKGRLHELSFKSAWLCLRYRLFAKYSYKEELVLELFKRGDELAVISIGTYMPEAYENAMSSLFAQEGEAPSKYWEQVNLILNTAKDAEFIEYNPVNDHMVAITNRMTKRQQEVRNALSKKTFEIEEEKYLLKELMNQEQDNLKWMEDEPEIIAVPIAATAVPDFREAAALRWMDLVQIGSLSSYQLHITQYIANDGTLRPVFERKPEQRRCVPLTTSLARLLLVYKEYLQRQYNLSDDQLALVPIILKDHHALKKGVSRIEHCDPSEISRQMRNCIDKLEIESYEVVLPDERDGKTTDLNAYGGNLLKSNLRYRLRHLCMFTEGEICYFLGQKAPDTFSAHYCAYDHPVLQHRMACKLNRWMSVLNWKEESSSNITYESMDIHEDETLILSGACNEIIHTDFSITPENGKNVGAMDIEIASNHGVSGTIILF